MRAEERARLHRHIEVAGRAVHLVHERSGRAVPRSIAALVGGATEHIDAVRLARLRAHLNRELGDEDLTASLEAALRGDYDRVGALTPPLRELVDRGLVRLREITQYRIEVPPE
jgi:hypothetical protein